MYWGGRAAPLGYPLLFGLAGQKKWRIVAFITARASDGAKQKRRGKETPSIVSASRLTPRSARPRFPEPTARFPDGAHGIVAFIRAVAAEAEGVRKQIEKGKQGLDSLNRQLDFQTDLTGSSLSKRLWPRRGRGGKKLKQDPHRSSP